MREPDADTCIGIGGIGHTVGGHTVGGDTGIGDTGIGDTGIAIGDIDDTGIAIGYIDDTVITDDRARGCEGDPAGGR